jgi:uncharacterized protein YeaO (DUF488 family)
MKTMAVDVRTKRIYDPRERGDGHRVLIDHVWPRGVSRERARLDDWARDLAPSDELRNWFHHDPERFGEFRTRYAASSPSGRTASRSGAAERLADDSGNAVIAERALERMAV